MSSRLGRCSLFAATVLAASCAAIALAVPTAATVPATGVRDPGAPAVAAPAAGSSAMGAPASNVPAEEPRRALGLAGAPNFRDIGGYGTADGRHVRWGRVYRSSALNHLTPTDVDRVRDLHLAAVIDLRTAEERAQAPSRWSTRPLDVFESSKPNLTPVMDGILEHAQTASGARDGMTSFYAAMPDTYRPEYAAMFHRIAQGELPLLVHCTAGKDRTGVATALLLRSVGVPRSMVIRDYALTGTLVPAPVMVTDGAVPTGGSAALAAFAQLPRDSRLALWDADAVYVEAALDAVDREYGSVDGYLTRGLGLSDLEVRAIRRSLID